MQLFGRCSLFRLQLKLGVALIPFALVHAPAHGQAQSPVVTQTRSTPAVLPEPEPREGSAEEALEKGAILPSEAVDETAEDKQDIVVTGTSLRGVAPTGSNVVTVTESDIQASGASSANQLLAQIPQLGGNYFNNIPQLEGSAQGGLDVNRPNARGVPQSNLDTGVSTLVLVNGQRQSGGGIRNVGTDPDGIPVALLQRVELNTDGGSSVYGSDAIGGTLNFVTRRTFDGVLASGRYGFADPYEQWDVNAIVGKIWGGTSAYVSYSHSENNMLLNGDRDFYRVIDWPTGREVGTSCDNPNVRVTVSPRVPATATAAEIPAVLGYFGVSADGVLSRTVSTSTTVPVVNGGISSPNLCTLDAYASAVAAAKRDNVMATFSHDFSDAVELTVRGRWSKTRTTSLRGPFNTTLTARPANPYYQNLTGTPYAGQNQTVLASFGPAFGNDDNLTTVDIEGWGISPELRWEIGSGWQLRVNTSFDRTKTERWQQEYNSAAITAATSAGANSLTTALNPYNVEASNPAILANIRNWERRGESFNEIINARAVLDGSLFELPGGSVRVALGAEYLRDRFGRRNSVEGVPGFFTAVDASGDRVIPLLEVMRNTKSVFGELNIPIFSDKNELPLLHELRVSLQGRYDSYSDFGDTFNPRIGANWSPTDWLTFRGNWGTTFRAPSVIDSLGTEFLQGSARSLSQFTFLVSPDPSVPAPPPGAMAVIYDAGVFPGLEPQTGTNWSVGADVNPFSGFRASVSYYHITYKNQFGAAVGNSPYSGANATPPFAPSIPGSVVLYPDSATANAYIDAASNSAAIRQQLGCGGPGGCAPIYMLFDLRTRNLAAVSYVAGIDYSMRYTTETGFGSLFFNVSGNIQTKNSRQATLTSAISDQLAGSLHRVSATVGGQYGEHLRAQMTWNRTDGYDRPTITANNNGQTHIDSFNVFNFFASWDVKGQGVGSDLQFTLGIDNVFDAAPPQNRTNGSTGFTNGSTIGRLIQIGVSKRF